MKKRNGGDWDTRGFDGNTKMQRKQKRRGGKYRVTTNQGFHPPHARASPTRVRSRFQAWPYLASRNQVPVQSTSLGDPTVDEDRSTDHVHYHRHGIASGAMARPGLEVINNMPRRFIASPMLRHRLKSLPEQPVYQKISVTMRLATTTSFTCRLWRLIAHPLMPWAPAATCTIACVASLAVSPARQTA